MEGEFLEMMMTANNNKNQRIPLYLFLLSDCLIFCRPQKKRTIPPRYKFLKIEKLYTVEVNEEETMPNVFQVATTTR